MSDENGVFFVDNAYFWRIGDVEKGGFYNLTECAKDYCVALMDSDPAMRESFDGSTWREIYELAGLPKEVRAKL